MVTTVVPDKKYKLYKSGSGNTYDEYKGRTGVLVYSAFVMLREAMDAMKGHPFFPAGSFFYDYETDTICGYMCGDYKPSAPGPTPWNNGAYNSQHPRMGIGLTSSEVFIVDDNPALRKKIEYLPREKAVFVCPVADPEFASKTVQAIISANFNVLKRDLAHQEAEYTKLKQHIEFVQNFKL